ncbi:MAG: hypothetical protein NC114_12020, partial [Ruminococcus flavefaciens]|nr:hypothetical protein [Ruminococcus flavefaciens]
MEETSFHLECNGEPVEFTITKKGLKDIHFGCDYDAMASVEYYDKEGEYLPAPSLHEVARIDYFSPMFCLIFDINGNNVRVKALDNTTHANYEVLVTLYYEHQVQTINLSIAPGQPLKIIDFGVSENTYHGTRHVEKGILKTFNNNTDHVQRMVFYPYKDAPSKIKLQVPAYDFWAQGATGMVNLPSYINGQWHYDMSNQAEIQIQNIIEFYSSVTNIEESYILEVPAHSKVTTVT